MDNFDRVFQVIKRKCEQQKHIAEISCFEAICKEANIQADKLPKYLSHLQEIGLIKYSLSEKYIYLTALGQRTKDK